VHNRKGVKGFEGLTQLKP